MSQKNTGIHRLLSSPLFYSLFQTIMSGFNIRKKIVKEIIRKKNANILDIGCGPGEILEFLPKSKYYGYDTNKKYISYAKLKYGDKGKFFCKKFTSKEIKKLPKFDYVLFLGIMHHLSDFELNRLLNFSEKAIKKGGKLVTLDPIFVKNQNTFARFIIDSDRGKNIRTERQYKKLIRKKFNKINSKIIHQKFIPYTWFSTVSEK